MEKHRNAPQAISFALIAGALLDFALAAMFGLTDIVDLGDEFVNQVVVATLIFAGIMTLAIRPWLLKKIEANQSSAHNSGNQKLID